MNVGSSRVLVAVPLTPASEKTQRAEHEQGYSEREARAGIILSAKFIETSLRHVDDVFGSFDRFVNYGLGLSDADVRTLRDTYVVS